MQKVARYLIALSLSGTVPAQATNDPLQDLFFRACINPTAGLAARCAQTPGGLGDLSADSESSLNPSQGLAGHDNTLDSAHKLSQEIRERLSFDTEQAGERVEMGRFSLVVNARATDSEYDRQVDLDPERGYEESQKNAELGLDYRLNDRTTLGAWLHWRSADVEFDTEAPNIGFTPAADAGKLDSSATGVTAYVSTTVGAHHYIDAAIGYSRLDQALQRHSVFQESSRTVAQTTVNTRADVDGTESWASLNWGYAASLQAWQVQPFVGLTYVSSKLDNVTERDLSNSGLAMAMDFADRSRLTGQLGVRVSRVISTSASVLVPHARFEFVSGLDSERSRSRVRYVNDPDNNWLTLTGSSPDDSYFDLAVGFSAILPNGWIPYLEYQVTTGAQDLDRYRIAAGLRVEL